MVWIEFLAASLLVVLAAIKLAEYGDVISERTGLGGMFIGTLLLAGATSLPELLTTISSLGQSVPNLAAGNVFGSNMFNILLLAVLDLSNQRTRILRVVATRHALTASLATLLMAMAVFFILADLDVRVGWVGLGSLLLMVVYVAGVWLIRRNSGSDRAPARGEAARSLPPLWKALVGFGMATAVLILVVPWLVRISVSLAEITGLGTGFVGAALLGVITSLPELVAVLAAARIGAYDLAIGNLFGSNVFNMFALGLTDVFYTGGSFLEEIDITFALAGAIGLILTNLALIGNLARVERRLVFVEIDALLILVGYAGGLWLLYARGVGA
jgi:cation:H+ antiporter